MKLSGKTILVLGLKRTGTAVVRCVAERGGRVRVTERQTHVQLATDLASLADIPFDLRLGAEDESLLDGIDVVPSPGVPRTAPVRNYAHRGEVLWARVERK